MAKENGHWMPMYWADYLAGTQHFSTFQHGAYQLLIAAYWCNGGPITADPSAVAQICKTTKDKLARYGFPVLAKFTCKDGLLYHQRIDLELSKTCQRIAAASAKAHARWHPGDMLSTITTTKEERKKSGADAPFDEMFLKFWEEFPRKDGSKLKASQAFLRAKADPQVIVDAAGVYSRSEEAQRDEGKYSIGPVRWLEEERWVEFRLLSPEEIEANKDKADRLFGRGKYAEKIR